MREGNREEREERRGERLTRFTGIDMGEGRTEGENRNKLGHIILKDNCCTEREGNIEGRGK